MDRLTKKFNGEYYCKNANTMIFNTEIEYNTIQKLGKLEDLMEEYDLKNIEKLENMLAIKCFSSGNRNSGKQITLKGILYNKLSEELGCPLEVAFRKCEELEKENKYNFYCICKWYDDWVILEIDTSIIVDIECNVVCYLPDYQKTWWLKGEK